MAKFSTGHDMPCDSFGLGDGRLLCLRGGAPDPDDLTSHRRTEREVEHAVLGL